MQLSSGVEVICISQQGIWAFNKPSGVLSHPNKPGEEENSLIVAPYDLREEAYMADEGPFFLLHRLDGPTSGVILATPYAAVARDVKELIRARKVRKTYNAIVAGRPRKPKELWTDKLQKTFDRESGGVRGDSNFGGRSRGREIGGGAPAETQMTLLKTFQRPIDSSLLELRPLTGRTHQLRIQCARRKMPIIGDATYGDFRLNRELKAKTLLLHALSFEIPSMNFYAEAELPEGFTKWGK
jgi:23S rRNA pseudouridine955/2504/2580 synthase